MRSIGKRNIRLVEETVKRLSREKSNMFERNFPTEEEVIEELPSELWDTWEMAHQEIVRIIHDTKMDMV